MSMQIRLKDANGVGTWLTPERDITIFYTKTLRATLVAFEDFKDTDAVKREEIFELAGELGKLIVSMHKEKVDHQITQERLKAIRAAHPAAMSLIEEVFFQVLFGQYTAWMVAAKPKTAGDSELPLVGLDQIREDLARYARGVDEGKRPWWRVKPDSQE